MSLLTILTCLYLFGCPFDRLLHIPCPGCGSTRAWSSFFHGICSVSKKETVDMYVVMMTNQKYLPAEKIVFIKQKLLNVDEEKFNLVSAVAFKAPTTILLVSIFLGTLGIDRFMLEISEWGF